MSDTRQVPVLNTQNKKQTVFLMGSVEYSTYKIFRNHKKVSEYFLKEEKTVWDIYVPGEFALVRNWHKAIW